MHEVHARIYPNDKRKRHLAHTVIRMLVGCGLQGYKLPSERIVAVICMDDIAGIDDYKERRTGEVYKPSHARR